jgi:hypothetical protein
LSGINDGKGAFGCCKRNRQAASRLSKDIGLHNMVDGWNSWFIVEDEQMFTRVFVDRPISACENQAIICGLPGNISR